MPTKSTPLSWVEFVTHLDRGATSAKPLAIFGKHEAQVCHAVELLKTHVQPAESFYAEELSSDLLMSVLSSSQGLFGVQPRPIIDHCERQSDLRGVLSKLHASDIGASAPILIFHGILPKSVDKLLASLEISKVPCTGPLKSDWLNVVAHMAGFYGLSIPKNAASYLLSCLGEDLVTIKNELKSLSLTYADQPFPSKEELSTILHVLKEEHAFKISDALMEGNLGASYAIIKSLLADGQSPIALLGFLARHCRISLAILEGQNPRLPGSLIRKYQSYARKLDTQTFVGALNTCVKADRDLKGMSKIKDELVLLSLCHQLAVK